MKITVKQAMDTLRQALKDNPDYAHSWHCNLWAAFYDSTPTKYKHRDKYANNGASRFMKAAFDVEASK